MVLESQHAGHGGTNAGGGDSDRDGPGGAGVGSGAGCPLGPRDGAVRALGLPLIEQPPYAPELNPAERVFEALRAGIEGAVYPTIADKVAAVEVILAKLDADPERVTSLTGWHWIAENLHRLPTDNAA